MNNEISFFDCNISIGCTALIAGDRVLKTADVIKRLNSCNIYHGLVSSKTAISADPASGNMKLLRELRDHPHFYPVWTIIPSATYESGSPDQIKRDLKEHDVKGVVLSPKEHGYPGSEWLCGEFYDMLCSIHMPLFISVDPENFTWEHLYMLLENHRSLPVILRNAHYQVDRVIYKLLERFDDLYIDTTDYLVFYGIEEIVRKFGSEKLIFGSGAPSKSPGAAMTAILLSDISTEDKKKIAGENLQKILGEIDHEI